MTTTDVDRVVASFRAGFEGIALAPRDHGHDDVRALWNGSFDKRPALITRCRTTADVVSVVELESKAGEIPGSKGSQLESAIEAFEPVFFNNMVLVLDGYFVHRSRTVERKHGNPLNEVRVLCDSVMSSGGIMAADKTIKMNPTTSVPGYQVGDEIQLREEDFLHLSNAFFAEIDRKFRSI